MVYYINLLQKLFQNHVFKVSHKKNSYRAVATALLLGINTSIILLGLTNTYAWEQQE